MAKKSVKQTVEEIVDTKEIKYLKKLYEDFKSTMGAVLGDGKDWVWQHKFIVAVAFIAFLIFWNKRFTIKQFADEMVDRLKEDREW